MEEAIVSERSQTGPVDAESEVVDQASMADPAAESPTGCSIVYRDDTFDVG
jgi:hypothetical protein